MGNLQRAPAERPPRRANPSDGNQFVMSSRRLRRRSCPYRVRQGEPRWGSYLERQLAMYGRLKFSGDVDYEKYHIVQEDGSAATSVFNVEFSPLGNYVVAAMENGRALIVDPIARKLSHSFVAHESCVNFICFIDNITFATCSDDFSVKLWDVRSLSGNSQPLCVQPESHSNWVKNIHFHQASKCLVSSGFDKTVCLWNLDTTSRKWELEASEHCMTYRDEDSFLMRSALSPDGTILCLARHPIGFSMNSQCWIDVIKDVQFQEHGLDFSHCGKEKISMWPDGASYILSMRIFPDNIHVLSRCTDGFECEYLCVHSLRSLTLLYTIDESDIPQGIIKEPGVSSDGRVICSPFGSRVRIMGFDSALSPLDPSDSKTVTGDNVLYELVDISTPCRHSSVLSSRFSPTQMLVAAGTTGGDIFFAEPRFT